MVLSSVSLTITSEGKVGAGTLHFYNYENGSGMSCRLNETQRTMLDTLFSDWRLVGIETAQAALTEEKAKLLAYDF